MIYREATLQDIPQIQIVRHLVKENVLSDPSLVPDSDVEDYITRRGKGWVCEINNKIAGFAIADLEDHNIWALFLDPQHEKKGIGKQLHSIMLNWYFSKTEHTVWLSTGIATSAETFYRMQGWQEAGPYGTKEIKFEMPLQKWQALQ